MSLTLGQKQRIFSFNLAKLILKAYELGYEISFGEVKRSDEQAWINALGESGRIKLADLIQADFPELAKAIENNGKANGIVNTAHQFQIAADLNLFKNGQYLAETEHHRELGEYWKSLHPDNRWGGEFKDGNHYSMIHGGVK